MHNDKKAGISRIVSIAVIAIMIFTGTIPFADRSEAASNPLFVPKAPKVDGSYRGTNATRIPVLTYHMLASDKEKKKSANRGSSLVISQSKFAAQMKYLHDNNYRTISMEEFYLWHQKKIRLPKKSVLITFDDGKYCVVKYALPILKKYNMRGTIFMIGAKTNQKTKKTPGKTGRYGYIGLDVMNQTSKEYPNFEYQSHTWNMHRRIGGSTAARKFSRKTQDADMRVQYNKFRYTFLAYPFGAYSKHTMRAANGNHIKLAFTYGTNAHARKTDNRYAVKRIKISGGMAMGTFKKWVKPM